MSVIGINFALLTTLSWSFGIFPFTQAARRLGVNSLNHFRLLLATLITGLAAASIWPTEFMLLFQDDKIHSWFWLGLSGIIGLTIGDHFAFGMFAILGARLGSVLTTFAPAATLITSTLLIGENMSFIGIVGMFITIFGVIWISLSRQERSQIPNQGHGSIRKGIIWGILAAICQGAGIVLAKKGMLSADLSTQLINPLHATFIRLVIGTASLFILTIFTGKWKAMIFPLLINRDGGIKYAVAGTFFGPVFGVSLSLYTVSFISASVAQTIFSLVPVFALFLSYFLLREKISLRSFAGVVVAILGVMILIWRDRLYSLF